MREQVQASPNQVVKYIIMDFSKVSGVDSTGMLSFVRMMQWSEEQGITLILTGLSGRTETQFRDRSEKNEEFSVQFFPDLDHGLEWCENQIILKFWTSEQSRDNLILQLKAILDDENVDWQIPYLKRREYRLGEYLMKEGDAADFVYFIESGVVTAQLEHPNKPPVRLETMCGGRTVGELGYYQGARRTACVVCEQNSVVYTLAIGDLKNMENRDPEAASIFHRINVLLLSERVTHLTRTVSALERS